jgi:hypothetical protein
MRFRTAEGERPPPLEVLAATAAVGYSAGYAAGAGNQAQQLTGYLVVTALAWTWQKWTNR